MPNDGSVQLISEGSGKKIDTTELTVGANTVERQRVIVSSPSDASGHTEVKQGATVDGTEYGLITRALVHDIPNTLRTMLKVIARSVGQVGDPVTGRARVLIDAITSGVTLPVLPQNVGNVGAQNAAGTLVNDARTTLLYPAEKNYWANALRRLTTLPTTFVDVIDLPEWRPLSCMLNIQFASSNICSELRNTEDRLPFVWFFANGTLLERYDYKNDGHVQLASPAMAAFASGACSVVAPARGPRGTVTTGATTTSVPLSTALPASVGINQLANRGDGTKGFKVRIVGLTVGKTEERYVIANTSGTTPTLTLDSALSFTPSSGDTYEFLSGRVYLYGSSTAQAGCWKAYDILTNSMLANLGFTNLPTGVTDGVLIALDSLYVPSTNQPGEGFLQGSGDGGVNSKALTATASTSTTLTGQASGGDAGVLINEYRNFQIRIVKDTGTPAAVGQRRRITSHTAGASPVYTVPAWTTMPSATAQYVIENNDDILHFSGAASTGVVYSYAPDAVAGGQSADTWSTSTYATRGVQPGIGMCAFQAFGATLDAGKNARYSFIYAFRGGSAPSGALDVFDIAGAATGAWTTNVPYGGQTSNTGFIGTAGSCLCYDPTSKYAYLSNGLQQTFRFDAVNRVLEGWSELRWNMSSATAGCRMATALAISGANKWAMPIMLRMGGADLFQTIALR